MHISSSSQLFQALLALKEPRGFKSAAKHPEWLSAMDDEIHALKKNDTWVLVPRPQHHNVVGCRWIFKTKLHFDGPVVRPATVRIILSLAVTSGWRLHQLNVKNAFLHGFLNEEVYMEQPPGYTDPQFPQHVCRLKRALYGLKQAPRAWFHRFSSFLLKLGFHSSQANSSLFVYHSSLGTVYLLLYVDDMIITRSTPSLFKLMRRVYFSVKTKYALDLLQRASMIDAKPISTPFVVRQHLSAEGTLFSDPTLFRSLAVLFNTSRSPGLICPSVSTPFANSCMLPPRIIFVLSSVSCAMLKHCSSWSPTSQQSTRDLLGYSDADWAGFNPVTRPRSKHIAIDYHFVRELVDKGTLKIDFVPSHLQLADSLTKGVTKPQFYIFRSKLSVLPSTTLTLQGVIRRIKILHDTCCIPFLLA
ncbi:Retrovirus-related Pol polyprotein from transposon RE1 [Vitis vinifera]|uniref:Retrovirus-related Pol polyprotein from transposon RE1 n=1 Tax=Vitis vinifera TaxID=29760 RepID=A0A438GRR3_VITVI|nr:Retrovirus-related Pol polyprotein from transposon RE1 [Vitis vinifera]